MTDTNTPVESTPEVKPETPETTPATETTPAESGIESPAPRRGDEAKPGAKRRVENLPSRIDATVGSRARASFLGCLGFQPGEIHFFLTALFFFTIFFLEIVFWTTSFGSTLSETTDATGDTTAAGAAARGNDPKIRKMLSILEFITPICCLRSAISRFSV